MDSLPGNRFDVTRKPAQYTPANLGIVMQISMQDTETFKFVDTPIDTLEVVCRVEDLVESGLKYDISLSDYTGRYRGVIYKKKDRHPTALREFQYVKNGYARCIGQLRKFQNTGSFVISYMTNVNAYGEVIAHRAKVLWNYVKYIRGPENVKHDTERRQSIGHQPGNRRQIPEKPVSRPRDSIPEARSSTGSTVSTESHLQNNTLPNSLMFRINEISRLKDVVIETLKSSSNPLVVSTGITEREMYCMLGNKFSLDDIKLVFSDLVRAKMLVFTQDRTYVYNKY
jgi:hypothetical protein